MNFFFLVFGFSIILFSLATWALIKSINAARKIKRLINKNYSGTPISLPWNSL
jgi:hypothetical protein